MYLVVYVFQWLDSAVVWCNTLKSVIGSGQLIQQTLYVSLNTLFGKAIIVSLQEELSSVCQYCYLL